MNLPIEPKEHYFPLRGGLDLITPPYQIHPGAMIDCYRYEIAPSGGYKPQDGYERVDGHGVPSEAKFQYLIFSDPATEIEAGTIVSGGTSGAVGVSLVSGIVDFNDGQPQVSLLGKGVILLNSGQFVTGETISADGTVIATIVDAYLQNSELVESHELYFRQLAVEARRAQVQIVPGSGPVRGVWRYKGNIYAFRDNTDGTACVMYIEDAATGWRAVNTPILLPGGEYRFENTNFGGSASTIMMYGCDGKNKAFEFDGESFNQITTGMAEDAPILLFEHEKHLFLGFSGGSLQHSPPTQPRGPWSVVLDAGELGMGEELQDAISLPGGALGIWCKDSIAILQGTGVSTWHLTSHTKRSGGIRGTVQDCGRVIYLNETGLADLSATDAFGNFKSGTLSTAIQPLLNVRRQKKVTGSVGVASKNQYRIFFEDGYYLAVTLNRNPEFTQGHYEIPVRCVSASIRADDEIGDVYFGSDDGYVYKMDSGVSLDDKPMSAYIRLPYAHQGAPRQKKRYREISIELDAFGGKELHLQFLPDFNLNDPLIPAHELVDLAGLSGPQTALWNIEDWNYFFWEKGNSIGGGGVASGRIDGVSTEMGLLIYFNATSTITPLYVINGVFTYFNYLGRKH